MKKTTVLLALALFAGTAMQAKKVVKNELRFDPNAGVERTLTMPTGQTVKYKAYEKLWYVTNVEDTTYQYLNVFVPEGATQQSPIFLKNNVGGYMPSKPGNVSAGDATGCAVMSLLSQERVAAVLM